MKSGKLVLPLSAALFGMLATASAQTATTTQVTASPNPAVVGSAVVMTATVSSVGATGQVTFYDGATVLGTAATAGGTAQLSTILLPTGPQLLRARYNGDIANLPSLSAPYTESITGATSTSFAAPAVYAAQSGPSGIAVGDLNKDGKADLVIPNNTSGTFSILLGNGDGTFQPQVAYGGVSLPAAVVVGDFNGDANPDIAVIDDEFGGSFIEIFLGNGDGTLQTPGVKISVPGLSETLITADVNGDGLLDLVVGTATGIEVLLGNGLAGFVAQPAIVVNGVTKQIIAADFRNLGTADLAVTVFSGTEGNNVELLLNNNNGTGTFAAPLFLPVGMNPTSLAAADLNNDGILDLAVVNYADTNGAGNVSILLGTGNGLFQAASNLPVTATGDYPDFVVAGDFNGDGNQDLAVSNFGMGSVSVYYGAGNGQFNLPANLSIGSTAFPEALVAANFTGGGTLDLAAADSATSNISVLLGTGTACAVTVTPDPPLPALFPVPVNSVGTTFQLTVAPVGTACAYTISTDQSGFVHPGSSSGFGAGTISVTVDANTTGVDRTASLFIGTQTVPITQYFTTQVFADVPPGSFAFDAINLMSQYGITTGCGGGNYCPDNYVTRDQMAVFIIKGIFGADNLPTPPQTPIFLDVPAGSFGFNEIQEMSILGITSGCGGGNYCPGDYVIRAQMAKFIVNARYGAATVYSPAPVIYFPMDVPPSYTFFDVIQRMAEDGVTSGCESGSYCPTSDVSRAQMAVFIVRGELNLFLPAGEPTITSISPNTLQVGASGTFTITGENTTFTSATVIVPAGGVTASNIVVTSPTTMTATLTSAPGSAAIPVSIYEQTEPQEAVLPNGLTLTPGP